MGSDSKKGRITMNKLTIIGNLTRDPELRYTATGLGVCSFTVAVNRRKTQNQQQPETDYFRVTAWRERGEICAKYLSKGKKVCVIGPVSISTYTSESGKTYANLEVTADEVEFLSSRNETHEPAPEPARDPESGFEQVEMDTEDLPF